MWPSPCAASSGRKARIPWMTPHRLTPSTHFHAESGPNHGSAWLATPALLQTTCTVPKRSTAAAARALTAASLLTSVGTASVLAPRPAIFSEAASSAGCSTSASTTSSPARANRSASAKPIPLAAPVTTATFPAVSSMAGFLIRLGFTLRRLVRPSTPWNSRDAGASLLGRPPRPGARLPDLHGSDVRQQAIADDLSELAGPVLRRRNRQPSARSDSGRAGTRRARRLRADHDGCMADDMEVV